MAAGKGKVTIRGRFPSGTNVKLFDAGSADAYAGDASGKPVATAKTDKNGETTFEAPPGRYFAVAKVEDWNVVTEQHEEFVRTTDVTIHSADVLEALSPQERAQREAAAPEPPSPSYSPTAVAGQIREGARGTHDLDSGTPTSVFDPNTGMVETFATPVGAAQKKSEIGEMGAAPAPRQEDHRGVPLASSTLTGEAVPPQPQPPKQEDAPKGMLQASSTEDGVQVPAREVIRQEDFDGPQAVVGDTGTAFPVDPAQLTRSASGTGRQAQTGTSKPVKGTKPVGKKVSTSAKKAPTKRATTSGAKVTKGAKKIASKAAKKSSGRKAAKKTAAKKSAKKSR